MSNGCNINLILESRSLNVILKDCCVYCRCCFGFFCYSCVSQRLRSRNILDGSSVSYGCYVNLIFKSCGIYVVLDNRCVNCGCRLCCLGHCRIGQRLGCRDIFNRCCMRNRCYVNLIFKSCNLNVVLKDCCINCGCCFRFLCYGCVSQRLRCRNVVNRLGVCNRRYVNLVLKSCGIYVILEDCCINCRCRLFYLGHCRIGERLGCRNIRHRLSVSDGCYVNLILESCGIYIVFNDRCIYCRCRFLYLGRCRIGERLRCRNIFNRCSVSNRCYVNLVLKSCCIYIVFDNRCINCGCCFFCLGHCRIGKRFRCRNVVNRLGVSNRCYVNLVLKSCCIYVIFNDRCINCRCRLFCLGRCRIGERFRCRNVLNGCSVSDGCYVDLVLESCGIYVVFNDRCINCRCRLLCLGHCRIGQRLGCRDIRHRLGVSNRCYVNLVLKSCCIYVIFNDRCINCRCRLFCLGRCRIGKRLRCRNILNRYCMRNRCYVNLIFKSCSIYVVLNDRCINCGCRLLCLGHCRIGKRLRCRNIVHRLGVSNRCNINLILECCGIYIIFNDRCINCGCCFGFLCYSCVSQRLGCRNVVNWLGVSNRCYVNLILESCGIYIVLNNRCINCRCRLFYLGHCRIGKRLRCGNIVHRLGMSYGSNLNLVLKLGSNNAILKYRRAKANRAVIITRGVNRNRNLVNNVALRIGGGDHRLVRE